MAVNDLMMRIQLLADTGKSTAELKRLQTQLQALTNQLKSLEQTSLSPLANDLKMIKAAQSELKATNLQTFAKTLDDVKKSFSALSLPTTGVDALKKGYEDLEKQIKQVSVATNKHKQDTTALNARLLETKKNQLTADGQNVNQKWVDANAELKKYNAGLLQANEYIREERQWILDTKRLLKTANADYQASLVSTGKLDLSGLKTQLSTQKDALKQSQDGVKYYRESLKGLRDDMRNLEKIGKSISAKKLIDTATLFPGTQINKLTRDFNSTNDLVKQLKINLKSIQDSPLTFRINSTDSVRSIGTIKREITSTKEAIKAAGKIKFDPQINVGLAGIVNGQKIAFNETFDSLQKFNAGLLKQKSNVSIVNDSIKSYQSSLRLLREEAKTAATPNFTLNQSSFGLASGTNLVSELNRVKALMQEIQTIGNKTTVTSGITALQNSIRYASAELKATEAATVAPLQSKAKSLNAEYDALKLLEGEYKKLNTLKDPKALASQDAIDAQQKLVDAYRKQIEALNPAIKNQLASKDLVKERLALIEKEAALSKYDASLKSQGLDKDRERIANSKVAEATLKNQNALYRDQVKSIQLAMTAERDRAKQAASAVKTRSGGILDTTSQLNQQKSLLDVYKSNVSTLGEYFQSLKRIAQVTKENAAAPLSTLATELANARKLEEAQKKLISNKQKDNEVTRAAIEREKERYNVITRSQLLNNQLDKKNLQSRIDSRELDLKSLQGVTDNVKSLIAGTREEIAANREAVKVKQEQLQNTIFEAQQRIASGQLTKQQYSDEKSLIRSAIADQKELSKAYQQQLRDKREQLNLALKAEKASANTLKNQVKDLMQLRTEEARTKAVDLTRKYNQSQTSQGSLQQQIKETEASAKAEILRANALAQSAKQTKENAGSVLGMRSALQGSLRPVREFTNALSFMFGPQMAGFAAAGTIIGLTDSFISANKQVEQLVRGLNAISGGQGRAEFQYLVDVSNKLGVSIGESAHSFLQLEATTAGTAIEGAKTKQIFESFARALNVTGADAVTFNRAFRAVSQSLSKGQLYAEELKGQLAEALPGAIQVFAKAIDVTPKKFLAMVKAGQFAGQTLYDLYGLVAKQLDKTFKVGSEKDFTFVQKANLAKNAFVELSVSLGNTGIWKTLSDGMLLLRDGLKAANDGLPELSNTLTAEWEMIKSLYGSGAKELVDSLSVIGDGWGELSKLIPESISNISFKTLLDLPLTVKKAANDALTEIKVMAIETKALIDGVFGKGASDTIDISRGLAIEWDWFKGTIASAGEAAAAISIYIDKLKEAKDQRSSIMPEGRKARPFTEEMLPFENFLKSYRATTIDVPIQVSNETIARLKRQLDYLNGLLAKTSNPTDQQKYRGFITQSERQIESEIVGQRQLKDATIQENYNKWQELLKQNEAYEKQVLAKAKENAGIRSKVESDITAVRKEGDNLNQEIDQRKTIRDLSIETAKQLDESTKREQQRSAFYQDYNQQLSQSVAEKEKDIAITKNQLAYEKKILDIKQEQRDAQVGFAKARYNEWVKTGSLTQESADFLTKSAEDTSALKAIRDAQDAVEAYNAALAKGDTISSDELKLLREKALELLKLGSEKAKQTANEYKYNQLVEERIKLLGNEKDKANEGADAVYKAKIKAENPKAESDAAQKSLQDEASKTPITYRAIIKPEFDSSLPAQQSGLMFSSLRQEYQQTQQVFDNKLRVTVDDAQVNEALQSLTLYQSKIQDIQLKSLPNGQTEIIVTPKINESALQEGFRFIKTAALQASPTVTVKPVVDATDVAAVKKTSEEVKKDILSILDKDGKKVNFIVVANGVKKTDEEMKRLSAQKDIPVTAFADQSSLDETKKRLDDLGQQINKGLIGATTISPQGIQQTLDTTFGKDKYKLEIVPTLTGGVTEDGWIKNNEIKRNLIITPVAGATAEADAMIQSQIQGVKSGYEGALQKLRELDSANQKALEETPLKKLAEIDPTKALEQDAELVTQLSKTVTKYIDVVYRSSGSSDGATVQAATGGFIRGYGGGDRVHALLEQGEFILRKEAVRKLGLNRVFDLNNLNIPRPSRSVDQMSIPSFSGGGYVGSSNTININVPGSKSIQVSGSRESAMALANLLTRVGRAV